MLVFSLTFGSALSGMATLLICQTHMFKHHVWIISRLSRKLAGELKFESQFWASLGAWVFLFFFLLLH